MDQIPNSSKISLHQSCALLLGLAVQEALPAAIRIQSIVSEASFGYDFILPTRVDNEILPHVLQKLKRLIQQDLSFEMKTMMRENAMQFFMHQKLPIQSELIENMRDNLVQLCKIGESYDICFTDPIQSTNEIQELTLYEAKSGPIYYPALGYVDALRIKGAAFYDKKSLKEFVKKQEVAKKHDPVQLCKTLNLIQLDERPFWLPSGMIFRDVIVAHWKKACKKWGYQEVASPRIAERESAKRTISPLEDVFEKHEYAPVFEEEEKKYAFSTPFDMHTHIFKSHFREGVGPIRYAELVNRELPLYSKDTEGLFLTKSCSGDAMHIFCKPQEVASELISSLQFIQEMGRIFCLDYSYSLLLPKSMKEKEMKDIRDKGVAAVFIQALEKTGCEYQSSFSKGFLAGPRIELYAQNMRGSKWLIAALGLAEEHKDRALCTIAMSTFFSLERIVALLVEKEGGELPIWLAPEQVRILLVSSKPIGTLVGSETRKSGTIDPENRKFASLLCERLKELGIRANSIDIPLDHLSSGVFDSYSQKVPMMVVIGDEEVRKNRISVRYLREGKKAVACDPELFLQEAEKYFNISEY